MVTDVTLYKNCVNVIEDSKAAKIETERDVM